MQQYNVNSTKWPVVKACLVAGLYPNLARFDPEYGQIRTCTESKVKIHHSSVNKAYPKKSKSGDMPSHWMVYTEMTRAGRNAYIKGVSFVSPAVVALLAGPAKLPTSVWESAERSGQNNQIIEESSDSEEEVWTFQDSSVNINLDPWITFRMSSEDAQSLLQIRQKLTCVWLRRLSNVGPGTSTTGQIQMKEDTDRQIISVVTDMIQIEDNILFDKQNTIIPSSDVRSGNNMIGSGSHSLRSGSGVLNMSLRPGSSTPGMSRAGPAALRSLVPPHSQPPPGYKGVGNDFGEMYEPPWIDESAVFFIVRPSARSLSAVEAAKSRGKASIWSFSPGVERKMMEASGGNIVYVFYSVLSTQYIQGCASLSGEIVHEGSRVGQRIHWINKQPLCLDQIYNCIDLNDYEGKDLIPLTREMATDILNKMISFNQIGYDSAMKGKYRKT